MKLHLPVRLFRAVMALFPLVVSTISQPLYAEAPDDAVEVILIDEDALRADIPTPLLGNDVEFWYFSDSPELSILSEATSSVFVAEEEPCLAFEELGYSENSVAVTDISGDVSTLTLSDNGSMTNMSRSYTEYDSDALTLSSNGSVMTETSRAYEVDDGGTLALNGKGSLMFSNYVLSYYGHGGAIYGGRDVTITMRDNESVSFIGNSSGFGIVNHGGAIYAYNSTITLSDNKSVLFSGNSSRSSGGAICGGSGEQGTCALTLSGNRSVTFRENSASTGGAINTGNHSTITLNDNESVLFSGNSASGASGAINADNNSTIILSNNKSVTFSGNTASSGSGGAIGGFHSNTIQLNYNENVTFSENSSGSGGAIFFQGSAELIGNETVTFSGNSAGTGAGGAIDGSFFSGALSRITLSNNGIVTFSGNSASSGGAIWYVGSLNIRNNDYVLFEKNVEKSNSNYRLNSICTLDEYATISLSAAEGASIEFRDSVYMGSGNIMYLNGEYGGIKQTGDIIFTGKYTETHLNEILEADGAERLATAEEIRLSRTTEVYATTYLYGGRLRIEDGAVYKGNGIIAESGSASTVLVKDAVLSHAGYELYFGEGTTLELTGNNSISGNIDMSIGSSLRLNAGTSLGVTDIIGDLYIGGGMTLALSNDAEWRCENGVLLYVAGDLTGWDADTLTVTGAGTYNSSDVSWVGNLLVLNYNAETFNRYFRGSTSIGRLSYPCEYRNFSEIYTEAGFSQPAEYSYSINIIDNGSVTFNGNTASSTDSYAYGGAIYGNSDSTITLSDNVSVTFIGNTASVFGGAIYGGTCSTITLNDNESVTFRENTASSTDSNAFGGAIYGSSDSTITLNDNGSVTFSGNTASSTDSNAFGGAIYGSSNSTIVLNGNGSVTFSGNTASSTDSNAYGGAIFGDSDSTIELSGNGSVTFSGNTASASSSSIPSYGGAIYGYANSTIALSNNGSVEFSGNSALNYGGAISVHEITLSDNGSVTFSGNTASSGGGGAIYGGDGSTIELSGNGSVEFSGNSALNVGGAIYGYGNSTIALSNNGSVTFSGNTADGSGGAIYGYANSTIALSGNGSVEFSGNTASIRGGAIYGGTSSTIELSGNESVEFSGNTVSGSYAYGGAIDGRTIALSGNGSVTFNGNMASWGGAILGLTSDTITLNENDNVTFNGNTASSSTSSAYGGAIYGGDSSIITLSGNGSVTFSGNTASASSSSSAYGGAIYGGKSSAITLSENDSVNFRGNTAENEGGAVYHENEGGAVYIHETASLMLEGNVEISFIENSASDGGAIYGEWNSTITLSDNGSVTFSGNTASSSGYNDRTYGGAIHGGTIELNGNGSVTFSGNSVSGSYAYGGAIYGGSNSTIELSNNGSVTFSGNTADGSGGAIYGDYYSTIALSNNGSVTFSGNSVSGFSSGGAICGRAITLNDNGSVMFNGNTAHGGGAINGYTIELNRNGRVTFSENSASSSANAFGGAIHGGSSSPITLNENDNVTFNGNSASSSANAYGGAIHGGYNSTITLSGNGSVTFSGNTASSSGYNARAYGGAIHNPGNLSIRNNDSVLFEKNAEISDSSYRLRSIYAGGSGAVISLSAAEGNSIEFRDSVYIDSGSTVELNADYTDAAGVVHKQTGDIIFTGKYTEQHLNELLSAAGEERTATESEVLSSRTSVVSSVINLYGGRLRVEDGAVLDCAGLNVAGGESRVSGTGSLVLGGGLSVADGADVILEVAASAAGVTVGDDASLSLRGNFSLTPGEEDSVGSKLITVGRNAELSLTDSSLLGQVALADETSGLYYQYTNGAKLLQFSGDLGTGGLNLTTEADGYTVTVSGGTNFAGDITVLDGAVFDFRGNNTTLDAAAKISLDSGSTMKLSGSDYAVMSDVLKRATGAGNARLESEAYLSHEDKIQLTGNLIVGSGGSLYLGELPNGVHGGDAYTNPGTAPVAPCTGTLVLDGGSLTFRGSRMELGRVDVTANSSLEIWDQAGSNQRAHEYCSIAELNVNASLQLATTWKSKLDIDVLQGSGAVTVGSSHAHHEVRVHDLSGYTGLLSAAGDKTTLELNLLDNTTLNAAAQISMDAGSTLKLSGSDYAVMSDVLKRATGAGNARLESDAYLSHEDKIQLTGDLIVGSGGRLYLGELPNNVHGGDLYTDSGTASVAPCTGTLVLDGGSLTFRGSRMELGRVDVTANSSLEIWDQAGSNQKAQEHCSIAELNVNASLQLATTWKSKLDIDVLQGSGAVTVGSSKEYREVRVHDLSGYTGVLSATGSKTTLGLNLVSHSELNADSVQLSNGATATLSGSGTYHLATAKTLSDGVSLAEDWSGTVRLSGATLVDDTLSGLSNANSSVELNGVSGYLSRADAQTGAQTYDVNLKLTDNESAAAWNLNNGYNGDKRIFTGEITGTGTLERSSYRGTHQTLVFTGDTSGWTGAINHLPDSGTSSGAPISTNVTFSGTQVLNVSTSTNGKGELNVTLDDEHLQAGSKVSVNGAIGANRLTVTEGTTVSLNNEVNVNTLRAAGTAELSADASVRLGGITLSADNPVSALISGVESTGSTMSSLYADAVVKNISIISTVSAYTISSMTLQGVQFATGTEQTALTLSGVVFDDTCSFSVGETGQILLDKAILTVLVGTPVDGGNGVLALDYSDLFHCTASGELEITMDKDVEQLLAAGYHTITLDLGDDVNYDNLNLTLNGATYAGNSQGGAQFSLRAVPEPTSATLSLLALAALAARRRRR